MTGIVLDAETRAQLLAKYFPEPVKCCKRGHEMTVENALITKKGRRVCRTCKRELDIAAYHRRKA